MAKTTWNSQVPVYLFVGFLESGKTSFIIESLQEADFAGDGERNLCLITEKGLTPISKDDFSKFDVEVEMITDKTSFTQKKLQELNDNYRPEKILLECNGMWMIEDIFDQLPENWIVVQQFTFFDTVTFQMYNNNMRNLVYDKLKDADVVAFNRFEETLDVMEYHKIVRAANRGTQIVYELKDGRIKIDEIEDPLPFDENADFIDLDDRDYAYWYRDFAEDPDKYVGKKMRFKGLVVTEGLKYGTDFGIGRHLMTCCIDDVQFVGVLCNNFADEMPKRHDWIEVTGTIMQDADDKDSLPVMNVDSFEVVDEPEQPVATFY